MSIEATVNRIGTRATFAQWQESQRGPHVATFADGERSPEFRSEGAFLAWLGAHRKGRACGTSLVVKIEEGSAVAYAYWHEKGAPTS